MPAAAIAATAASIVSVFFTCSPSWSVPVPVGRCVLPGRLPRAAARRCREKLAAALGARCAEHLARRSLLLDTGPEEHTSGLQSLMRTSYAVFSLATTNALLSHNW